jgi:hypothetical protein
MDKDGKVCLVEVKQDAEQRMTREQVAVAKFFHELGIRVYRWSPDVGFSHDFE